MLAEMVTFTVNDPFTIKVVLYIFAIVVGFSAYHSMKNVIWKIFPRVKAQVTNFKFDGSAGSGGAVAYEVDVEYDKKGVKCSKKVTYTEDIISDGRPKYLPGDTIILRVNPITGRIRTDEVVRLYSTNVVGALFITVISIALIFAAVKFHLFANEHFKDTNETQISKNSMEAIVYTLMGTMFIVPFVLSIIGGLYSLIRNLKIKADFNNGKYVPLTTVLAGYTVVRRKSKSNGHHRTFYYYYPYYKYQLGNEIFTVTSEMPSYQVEHPLIGKNFTCYRRIDNDKAIGYSPADKTISGDIMQIVFYGCFLAFFIFVISNVTF